MSRNFSQSGGRRIFVGVLCGPCRPEVGSEAFLEVDREWGEAGWPIGRQQSAYWKAVVDRLGDSFGRIAIGVLVGFE